MKMSPRLILGEAFVEQLLRLGIADDRTTRVVIDAHVGHPVRLYTERIGDDRLIDLALDGGITLTDNSDEAIAK